jgi:3-hydroxyacyl-CoA dehydrogenase
MRREVRKVAVLGSGVMGSAIAAHFANAGIPSILLDIVPRGLSPDEEKRGLTLKSPQVRNRLARTALDAALKAKPAPFFHSRLQSLVEIGNFEDDLARVGECDWVIEVVVENMAIKKKLLAQVAGHRKPGAIVTTNTSGLSVAEMSADCAKEFRQHFLGTHFFNPVRYMKLLEIIPGPDTLADVVVFMAEFGERVLGKGIVYCKDTPNFIGNRIGVYGMMRTMHLMLEHGYSIDEVDAITGPPLGHPRSASFRTGDLAGLDTLVHVCENVYESVPNDESREVFRVPQFVNDLVAEGRLGNKTGGGFYKESKDAEGKKAFLVRDPKSGKDRPVGKIKIASLDAAKNLDDPADRIRKTVYAEDRAGELAWPLTRDTLAYSARRIGEITDSIVEIDHAMCWGYNWELGPFEAWDALGVAKSVERMKAEGTALPKWIDGMLSAGKASFYVEREGTRLAYSPAKKDYVPVAVHPRVILLPSLKKRSKVVKSNGSASLIDIGDGVLCLEFHAKMNAVDADIISMLGAAVDEVSANQVGLVIANHDPQAFSAGANLMLVYMAAQSKQWAEIEKLVNDFQQANLKLKTSPRPVIVAPAGLALGGGAEMVMHGTSVRAHCELYCGLVEVGVGLIPGAGGVKEMALRATDGLPEGGQVPVDLTPFIFKAFENIAMAKVSMSAEEARENGFLRPSDGVTLNRDHLIQDAKDGVLHQARMGFKRAQPRSNIRVGGDATAAVLVAGVQGLVRSGYASEYDLKIATKLAHVLTGGYVATGTRVSEQYLLDLEREAFVSLVAEPKTQERIQHMLMTNKPLRN